MASRAAVLGATDGLVSFASLMMGMSKQMLNLTEILTGLAGLVAGACSMAIGEFVSAQLDIELAQMKRHNGKGEERREQLPNALQATASALAFILGEIVPLLAAAFIGDHNMRLGVVVAAVTSALAVFGGIGAMLGKASIMRTGARVLVGGWMDKAITFGLTKLIG